MRDQSDEHDPTSIFVLGAAIDDTQASGKKDFSKHEQFRQDTWQQGYYPSLRASFVAN